VAKIFPLSNVWDRAAEDPFAALRARRDQRGLVASGRRTRRRVWLDDGAAAAADGKVSRACSGDEGDGEMLRWRVDGRQMADGGCVSDGTDASRCVRALAAAGRLVGGNRQQTQHREVREDAEGPGGGGRATRGVELGERWRGRRRELLLRVTIVEQESEEGGYIRTVARHGP